jgi:RNA polymerase sigma factor (sigma-70 family)
MGSPAAESNGSSHYTDALYREHGAAVAALCRSLLRDRAEAEDAAQQVFLSAHRSLLNGAVPREPLAWLLAVARNECYARFRQRATVPLPGGDAPEEASADASVHVLRARALASVWDEVRRMPRTQREAFLLREIRGLSYGQLADELSLSTPSIRSLLLRARTRLRRRLGDVATALGATQWLQPLIRLFASGDGTPVVPAAAKAAAVGLGALALTSGGDLPSVTPHASTSGDHAAVRHRAVEHVRPADALPVAAGVAPRADRSELGGGASHASRSGSDSDTSGSSGSSDGTSGSGGDDSVSNTSVTASVSPPTTSDGGGGSPSSSSSDGGGSTSSSSSDGGPGLVTTTSSSDPNSGPDSGSTSSGSDGSISSDGGTGHGGSGSD